MGCAAGSAPKQADNRSVALTICPLHTASSFCNSPNAADPLMLAGTTGRLKETQSVLLTLKLQRPVLTFVVNLLQRTVRLYNSVDLLTKWTLRDTHYLKELPTDTCCSMPFESTAPTNFSCRWQVRGKSFGNSASLTCALV